MCVVGGVVVTAMVIMDSNGMKVGLFAFGFFSKVQILLLLQSFQVYPKRLVQDILRIEEDGMLQDLRPHDLTATLCHLS